MTDVTTCDKPQKASKMTTFTSTDSVTYIEEITCDTCDKSISSQLSATEKTEPVTSEAIQILPSHVSRVVTPSFLDYLPEHTLEQCNEVMLKHMSYYCNNLGVDKRAVHDMAIEVYKEAKHLYVCSE